MFLWRIPCSARDVTHRACTSRRPAWDAGPRVLDGAAQVLLRSLSFTPRPSEFLSSVPGPGAPNVGAACCRPSHGSRGRPLHQRTATPAPERSRTPGRAHAGRTRTGEPEGVRNRGTLCQSSLASPLPIRRATAAPAAQATARRSSTRALRARGWRRRSSAADQRTSSMTCTGPPSRISPLPTASMRLRNAYFAAAVSKRGVV